MLGLIVDELLEFFINVLGERMVGNLPQKLFSSAEAMPVWESVLPIMPNLKGFAPSCESSARPLRRAGRAYSPANIQFSWGRWLKLVQNMDFTDGHIGADFNAGYNS